MVGWAAWVTMVMWFLAPGAMGAEGEPATRSRHVPVIATGWDSPDTKQFREGLAAFEQWGVFDGTTLRASRRLATGEQKAATYAFANEKWEWSELADSLADLKAAQPATCLENYLMLYSNPGDVDWFDDDGWREVVDHWRLLARLAHEGGLRGLLFDAEPYTPPYSQFLYRAQAGRDAHTFAEYRTQARQRGREVMEAVAAEFPEVTIFSYRLFSDLLGLLDSGDLTRALEPDTYGLLPAFVDGWFDVAPSTVRVIEGTEDIGYRANSRAEYDGAFTRLKLHLADFLDPEHREKVDRQFRVGHSLYLDAYTNPPDNPWHIDHTGSTAAARLAANLASALGAADGLVWLYGEKARWWRAGHADSPFWPDAFPGAIDAIRRARDPAAYARAVWSAEPRPANLLPNADFATPADTEGPPEGWFQWQDDASHGSVRTAGGLVELRAMLNGCFGVVIPAKAGALYAVRVQTRSEGRGLASLSVGWKTAEGVWTASPQNRRFVGARPPDADGWCDVIGLVEVPASAGQMVFMGAAVGQLDESDRCWFRAPAAAQAGP